MPLLLMKGVPVAPPGPPPVYVGATSVTAGNGTGNITLTPHASSLVGDLILITAITDGVGGPIDGYPGFTLVPYFGVIDGYVFHRAHDGSVTYTFTRSVAVPATIFCVATFRNAAFDTSASTQASMTTPVTPSVTPSGTALIWLSWGTSTLDEGSVVPAGFTDIPDSASGAMATEHGISNSSFPAGVPTGTFTASAPYAGNRATRAITVAVKGV